MIERARMVVRWWRPRSLGILLVLVLSLVLQAALGGSLIASPLPLAAVVLVAGSLGFQRDRRRSLAGWLLAAALLTLANQLEVSTSFSALNDLAFYALVIGAPVVLGDLLGTRNREIGELRARTALLAEQQELAVAAARAEEGARLAREVHAAIAQRVGEIALQAAGAERVASSDGARALEALARVEAAARTSLDDVRAIIGVLRTSDVGDGR
jgi:signal transduction histidine kinase